MTRAGASLFPIAADLLATEARLREAAMSARVFSGSFRLGVTEFVAVT